MTFSFTATAAEARAILNHVAKNGYRSTAPATVIAGAMTVRYEAGQIEMSSTYHATGSFANFLPAKYQGRVAA